MPNPIKRPNQMHYCRDPSGPISSSAFSSLLLLPARNKSPRVVLRLLARVTRPQLVLSFPSDLLTSADCGSLPRDTESLSASSMPSAVCKRLEPDFVFRKPRRGLRFGLLLEKPRRRESATTTLKLPEMGDIKGPGSMRESFLPGVAGRSAWGGAGDCWRLGCVWKLACDVERSVFGLAGSPGSGDCACVKVIGDELALIIPGCRGARNRLSVEAFQGFKRGVSSVSSIVSRGGDEGRLLGRTPDDRGLGSAKLTRDDLLESVAPSPLHSASSAIDLAYLPVLSRLLESSWKYSSAFGS